MEIQRLIKLLEQTFNGGAWHGPAVKETIRDVSADLALKRLPNTHSIIELVAHMVAWREFVIRKLQGDATYNVSDEANFPATTDWETTVGQLEESQLRLIDLLRTMTDQQLEELVPGSRTPLTYFTLLHGIIHHDLYHAGQISLITKANG